MKDSKKYSPKVTRLFNSLKRNSTKHPMPEYADPLEAVVYALICEQVPEQNAGRIYRRLMRHFIDLNDLRVSRREEILDVFNDTTDGLQESAKLITEVLNAVFATHDQVSLKNLGHDGKRQAHKELSEIGGITFFAVSYCFLTALDGHAIPLNAKTVTYLHENKLVHPDATDVEIAGFLERLIGAADAYEFYVLVREAAEQDRPVTKTKKAASSRKTTKKKTAKKKTTKKKTATKKKIAKKVATKKKTSKKKQVKKK